MSPGPSTCILVENVDGVLVVSSTDSKIVARRPDSGSWRTNCTRCRGSSKKKILLNFGKVQYCSLTVLGKLVGSRRRVDAAKGKLKLCCIHPSHDAVQADGPGQGFRDPSQEQAALNKY